MPAPPPRSLLSTPRCPLGRLGAAKVRRHLSGRLALPPGLDRLGEHRGARVLHVLGRGEQGERPPSGYVYQVLHGRLGRWVGKLGSVALRELGELSRVVPVPPPQVRAGSSVLHPLVEQVGRSLHASWPKPVDERPVPLFARRRVIDPPDFHRPGPLGHRSLTRPLAMAVARALLVSNTLLVYMLHSRLLGRLLLQGATRVALPTVEAHRAHSYKSSACTRAEIIRFVNEQQRQNANLEGASG